MVIGDLQAVFQFPTSATTVPFLKSQVDLKWQGAFLPSHLFNDWSLNVRVYGIRCGRGQSSIIWSCFNASDLYLGLVNLSNIFITPATTLIYQVCRIGLAMLTPTG
jgi:hypothetical protein